MVKTSQFFQKKNTAVFHRPTFGHWKSQLRLKSFLLDTQWNDEIKFTAKTCNQTTTEGQHKIWQGTKNPSEQKNNTMFFLLIGVEIT